MLDRELVVTHLRSTVGEAHLANYDVDGWKALKAFQDIARSSSDDRERLLSRYPLHHTGAVSAFNGQDVDYFIRGIWDANVIAKAIARHTGGRKPLDVLDFGCGAGRILRYLLMFMPPHRYSGCDVNPAAVDWLGETFSPAKFLAIPPSPPTSYADASFDVIYGWSIYSHFNEDLHLAWLAELRRIVRPGGLVMMTTHNDTLVERYGNEEMLTQRMAATGADYAEIAREYRSRGFAFWRSYPESARENGIDIDTFGMAFISRDYINREWSKLFDIVDIVPDAAPRWQDLIVLRRPTEWQLRFRRILATFRPQPSR